MTDQPKPSRPSDPRFDAAAFRPDRSTDEEYRVAAMAKMHRPNAQLERLADQEEADPGSLRRAGLPLSLRGDVAEYAETRRAHRLHQERTRR